MNEFKELCERVLEIPAPAGSTGGEILALARRSARRRVRFRLLVSTLVVSVVGLSVVRAPSTFTSTFTFTFTEPAVAEPVQLAQMPPPEALASHANQAADAVDRAVPGPVLSPAWAIVSPDGQRRALRLLFYSKGEEGSVIVYFQHTDQAFVPVDLCAPEVGAEIIGGEWGTMDLCYVMTVDGHQIRVAVGSTVVVATRFLRDGLVTVVARQGAAALLTPRQVARIAADPNILP